MKNLLQDKPLAIGLAALLLGQILYFFGFTTLFMASLVYVLAVGLPYPKIFRSLIARLVVGFVAAFSLLQLSALVQFFLLPESDFRALSLITFAVTMGAVVGSYGRVKRAPFVLAERKDAAAGICAAFFVVPFALLCFWGGDLSRITYLAGVQVPDGTAHFMGTSQMGRQQHLNYRYANYYPRGFHVASAFVADGLHLQKTDLNWAGNARAFMATYVFWAALLAFLLFYLAHRIFAGLASKVRDSIFDIPLAVTLGIALAPLYFMPLVFHGFTNYYYIIAAIIAGALLLFDYESNNEGWWRLSAYFLIMVGVGMSWPLLLPPILLAPILYLLSGARSLRGAVQLLRLPSYWWVLGVAILNLVPVYIHLKYATLTEEQGLNALGALRETHLAVLAVGLALTVYLLLSKNITEPVKRFASYVVLPTFVFDALLMAYQYLLAGELRYYSIKVALLLEIMLVALAAAIVVHACLRSGWDILYRWVLPPITLGLSLLLLIGLTANPLGESRRLLFAYFPGNTLYRSTATTFTELGMKGELQYSNNISLYYDAAGQKINGIALLTNWANSMQVAARADSEAAKSVSTIFSTLAYGTGAPGEQEELIAAVKFCIERTIAAHEQYYIITDAASAPKLKEVFGNKVTYVY